MSVGVACSATQTALYTLFSGDSTLAALCAIHDEPPEDVTFPYLLIGDVIETSNNRLGGKVGREMMCEFHIWTDKRGYDDVHKVSSRVDILLDNNLTLAITGYQLESCDYESLELRRDAIIREGVLKYKIRVREP